MRPPEIRGGLDTSVVVRLLTGKPEALSRTAYRFLSETQSRGELLRVSDLVVAESYFACQHHYGIAKEAVLSGLHALLAEPIFVVESGTLALLGQRGLANAKPGFVDRLIHGQYAKGGDVLITFEKAARKLEGVLILPAEGIASQGEGG